jgi:hypothetical protein
MPKENNCNCVVCQVERNLLDSLSTQTARTHFQALASNYPVLNHFDSPVGVIARLHEHEEVEVANHIAWNGILHALVDSIADGIADEIGQQLLLVAYAPAIHKVYREVCQKFPALCPDDVAQQVAVCFLETARSPEMQSLNGHLSAALARRFRQSVFRWAISEIGQSIPCEEIAADHPEPPTSRFEHAITLEKILSQATRDGLLSEAEHQLLLKLKREGFEVKELGEVCGIASEDFPRWFHRRLQTVIGRLRRAVRSRELTKTSGNDCGKRVSSSQAKRHSQKITLEAVNFSGEMCIRNSEKGFSPEPSLDVAQLEPDISQVAA